MYEWLQTLSNDWDRESGIMSHGSVMTDYMNDCEWLSVVNEYMNNFDYAR